MESRGTALGHGDGHCSPPKGGFGRNDSFHAGRGAFSQQYQQLHANSINSYTRVLKSFFSWCNEQGLTRLNIPLYKAEETVKETYSDAELTALLKKPDIRKTTFAEYRDWVIINFLLNCGSRAATVGAIQIRDVDLDGGTATRRTEKRRSFPFAAP